MQAFNVIWWDFNKTEPEHYNIMPFLINRYFDIPKSKRPKLSNFESIKEFIRSSARYQWWSRTEYEIIISDWPCNRYNEKVDIYQQIMMNLDIVADIFIKNIKKEKFTYEQKFSSKAQSV